jgi:hypothetical protein
MVTLTRPTIQTATDFRAAVCFLFLFCRIMARRAQGLQVSFIKKQYIVPTVRLYVIGISCPSIHSQFFAVGTVWLFFQLLGTQLEPCPRFVNIRYNEQAVRVPWDISITDGGHGASC